MGQDPRGSRLRTRVRGGGAARARGARAREGGVQTGIGRGWGRGVSGVRHSLRPLARCWQLRVGRRHRQGCDQRSLASPAVLGPVGRWATRSRAAAEEATRPPHGESRGRGWSRGRVGRGVCPQQPRAGGAVRGLGPTRQSTAVAFLGLLPSGRPSRGPASRLRPRGRGAGRPGAPRPRGL